MVQTIFDDNWPDEIEGSEKFSKTETDSRTSKAFEKGEIDYWYVKKSKKHVIRKLAKIVIFLVMAVLVVFGIKQIFNRDPEIFKITTLNWERRIAIEKFVTEREEGSKLPEGAKLLHYEKKKIGYANDSKSGGLKPVYADVYYYEISRWVFDRFLTSEGFSKDVFWPDVNSLGENERIGEKNENYFVSGLNYEGKPETYKIPFETWQNLEVNQKVKISSIIGD